MLCGTFFTIQNQQVAVTDDATGRRNIKFDVNIDASHCLFEGHFPGNPVVPGVVQIEMIRELFSRTLGMEMMLVKADTVKYLRMISPALTPQFSIGLEFFRKETDIWEVASTITSDSEVFLKFKGKFNPMAG
jgi:3-hydroxyacyl-[acyl-carrier-protein] dehydratase